MKNNYQLLSLIFGVFYCISNVALAELAPVTLQLKWQHQFQFAGYYAAIEQGYYKDAGLDVTLIPASENIDPVTQVTTGKADFGVGTSELLLHRANGKDVVVLGVIFQYSPLVLITKKEEESFKTLHDLVKKPIAIEPGSSEILAYLKSQGISIEKIETQEHDLYIEKLIKGEIIAQTAYTTTEPYILNHRKIEYQIFSPRSVGIDFYGDNLFTTQNLIIKNPELVKSFKEASLKGWVYAMSHTEETIDLIHKKYSNNIHVDALRYEADQMELLMKTDIIQPGYMNEGRWQSIMNIYKLSGMLPDSFELDDFLYKDDNYSIKLKKYFITISIFLFIITITSFILIYILYIKNQLLSSNKKYQQLLDLAPLSFIVVNKNGHIIEWNQAAQKLFGWTPQEAMDNNVFDLIIEHPLHKDINDIFKESIEQNTVVYNINENIKKDGNIIQCLWHNAPRLNINNEIDAIICIAQDITNQLLLEEELKKSKEHAEKMLAEHRQFLLMASHEFRTPLAIISQSIQLMILHFNNNQPTSMKVIDRINRAIVRMTEFMDKVYIIDKFDSDCWKTNNTNIDINTLLLSILEEHQQLFPTRKTKLNTTSSNVTIDGDTDLIRLAINNILSNAIKYSPTDSIITLDIKGNNNSVSIVIRDMGNGVDENLKSKLFTKYVRGNSIAGTTGTGMGLYVVKKIIDLHKGKIELSNHQDRGLIVDIKLPRGKD
jgi:PAS domain S-box-containing protein